MKNAITIDFNSELKGFDGEAIRLLDAEKWEDRTKKWPDEAMEVQTLSLVSTRALLRGFAPRKEKPEEVLEDMMRRFTLSEKIKNAHGPLTLKSQDVTLIKHSIVFLYADDANLVGAACVLLDAAERVGAATEGSV